MTAKEAYKAVASDRKIEIGDDSFALLRWQSPSNPQSEEGPFLVTIHGDVAVEIRPDGVFKSTFSAKAEGYFPYLGRSRKDQIDGIVKQLLHIKETE